MDLTKPGDKAPASPEFLSGGGEMGRRIREYDWSITSLGPVHTWPQSLRTCIRIMLASRQPIWIGWGRDLIKLYNDPYKAIVGGKHPWALGQPASVVWREIWHNIEPMLEQVMEEDEGTYVESQLLTMERNGYPEETYYTFSYTPIPGDNGGTAGMICANSDDTDRIISERQLKTLTMLGKNLTDTTSGAEIVRRTIATLKENPHDFPFACFYSISDERALLSDCTVEGWVDEIPREIDLRGEERLGRLMKQALIKKQPEVLDDAERQLGQLPRGAWSISPSKVIVLPIIQSGVKDPYGFLLVGLNPYRLPDEKYRGFFSLLADQVTTSFGNVHILNEERKRSEALAEIDRAKTLFFSNISHEFRTPLTLLLGPIEDAMNEPGDTENNRIRMGVAYRNALRMQKLVNTLLDFSRIEAGRTDGRFSVVDIAAFTLDLASSFRSAIEKAGLDLRFRLGPVQQEVLVDTGMWEKIVLNLVSNAFKYTREGSITVGVEEGEGEVRISVTDTGIGIPADQQDLIFDRFHRVENSTVRSQEGTGIGLALVRELVKMHKGRIDVSSRLNEGSAFTVSLPTGRGHLPAERIVAEPDYDGTGNERAIYVEESLKWLPFATADSIAHEAAATVLPALLNPATPADKRFKVLLADDNADMRDYVGRLLAGRYDLTMAYNGEDAYEKLLLVKPDLLLTDVMMPVLDGFGLLKKIRGNPATRTTPVIFLSARAGEEAKVEGLEAGADDYLIKPFSAKELIARVDANLKINEARRMVEQELTSFLLHAPFAIQILSGPDYITDLVNDKYLPIVQRKREELIGRPIFKAVPEARSQGYETIMKEVRRSGEPASIVEYPTMLERNGHLETAYLNVVFQPLRKLNGEVDRIMIVVEEVTERVIARKKIEDHASILEEEVKKRTKELNKLNINLQQSNEDLRQFAHVASHDLKEPVRKVKVYTGRLEDDPGSIFTGKARVYLEKINSAANRMLLMIEGVLHYSTINSTEQKTELVDLNRLIKNIESDLELPIMQKKAIITYSGLPAIEGAPVLLYQLFYNLINNSLKFSQTNIPCRISIIASQDNDRVTITLTDNGIGFDQEQSDRIFETFSRLNAKEKYEGTGLGLSLCKKIVQRHGGHIEGSGRKGEGAVFRIWLPLKAEEEHLI
jgi:PAS domain S-box-containing protein